MKKKLNWVDYVLILIVILAIAAIGYRLLKKNTIVVSAEKIDLFFEIESVEHSVLEKIRPNDLAADNRKQSSLGVVRSIEIGNAKNYSVDENGQVHNSAKEGFSSAQIRLSVNGKIGTDGIYIGSYKYLIGEKVILSLGHSIIYATVSGVESEVSK